MRIRAVVPLSGDGWGVYVMYSSDLEEAKVQLEAAQREVAAVTAAEASAAEALEEAGQKLRQLKAEAERLRELQDSGDQRAQVRALQLAMVSVPLHALDGAERSGKSFGWGNKRKRGEGWFWGM